MSDTRPSPHHSVALRRALFATSVLALAVGCNRPQPVQPTPIATPQAPTASAATPTPSAPQVVLVVPRDSLDSSLALQAETVLQGLAASTAMTFLRADALPVDSRGLAVAVVLPPDPGIQAWASSNPDVRVIAVGLFGVHVTPNLTVIGPDGLRYDQLGFALGYLAAMVTPEYRIGALVLDSSPLNLALARGFVAGGTYYCGLCRPVHPPYLEYPLFLTGGGIDLNSGNLATVLVAPEPRSLSDLGLPANARLSLVGLGAPSAELAPQWIASAEFDLESALQSAWATIQSEQAGTELPLAVRFHSVSAALVSEGRLALAERLLGDLAAGVIDTGVDPLTGEIR